LGHGSYSRVYKIQTLDSPPVKYALKAINKKGFEDLQMRE